MPTPPALKADIHALRARHQEAKQTLIQTIPDITAALSVEDRQIPTRDGSKSPFGYTLRTRKSKGVTRCLSYSTVEDSVSEALKLKR